MKSQILAAFAALPLLTGCCTYHKTTAWEYRVVHASRAADLEQKLNQAGREGFRVESSMAMPLPQAEIPETMVIMKRPLR